MPRTSGVIFILIFLSLMQTQNNSQYTQRVFDASFSQRGLNEIGFFHISLAYLSDVRQALMRAFRVLKPGGLLVLREPDRDGDLFFPDSETRKFVWGILNRLHPGDPFLGKKLKAAVVRAGFNLLHLTGSYDFINPDRFNSRMKALPEEVEEAERSTCREAVALLEKESTEPGWIYGQSRVEIVAERPHDQA